MTQGSMDHQKSGRRPSFQNGYTLVEIIVALTILAILSALAIPSYRNSVLDNRQRSAANELLTLMHAARNEATKQGNFNVIICASSGVASGCSGDDDDGWKAGALVFVDNVTSNEALDTNETVVTFAQGLPDSLSIKTSKDKFLFSPFVTPPNPKTNGTIYFCDDRGASHAIALVVNTSGRAHIDRSVGDGVCS